MKTSFTKALFVFLSFCVLNSSLVFSQDQKIADSLSIIYKKNELSGIEKMELLKNLSFNTINNSEVKLKYAEELITLAKKENNLELLYSGHLQKGFGYIQRGDIDLALTNFFKCVEISEKTGNIVHIGSAYMCIADAYAVMDNSGNAIKYYNESINLLRKANDSVALASALSNAGDTYYNIGEYENALNYLQESSIIFRKKNYLSGTAYSLGNIGMVYAKQGQDELALNNINEAISILEESEDFYPVSVYLTIISNIYFERGENDKAFNLAHRSLELAKQYGLKDQISDANLHLSDLYEKTDSSTLALKYYKDYIEYNEQVKNIETVEKMADLRTDFEVSQKQSEINQQKRAKNIIIIATVITLILLIMLAVGLFRRYNFIRNTSLIIEKERNRSDHLLRNILPEETANELKLNGEVSAKKFESVTVLFTDFKNFTLHAEHLSPEDLVKSLDYYFTKFDEIIDSHKLEKIKTMGDSYMCAGGLPFVTSNHAEKMVLAAIDMLEFVEKAKTDNPVNQTRYEVRIGISTGAVVAGVVGKRKFAYDIWGDTVNIASRMETYSDIGKINISEDTYDLVKDKFACSFRGEIDVKNKGMLKMYYVDGLKDKLNKSSVNSKISGKFEDLQI